MPGRIVAVRGQVPFTAGPGIEITQNKAIQLFLKQTNNLLKISSDGELYSDLQIENGIAPSGTFPVGVTVGLARSTDGRSQNGVILNAKDLEGNYIRRFYGADGKLYFDGGSGTLTEMATGADITEALSHLTKSDVGLGNVDNTSDLDKPISTATQTALNAKQDTFFSKGTTAPINPSEGDQWYDTTNDVMKFYDGTQWKTIDTDQDVNAVWGNITGTLSNQTDLQNALNGKQESLVSGTNIKTVNSNSLLGSGDLVINDIKIASTAPSNPTEGMLWYDTTNDVLKVYNGTSWDSVATGGSISDTAYGSGWDGQTTTAPSQNAVYDKISTMDTTIGDKANKVSSPTTDDLASLTSAGDIADSGIAKSTVELNTNKETGDAPTDNTSKYPSSHTVKKYVDDQVSAATSGAVSDAAYGSSWDGVTGIAPSKNAVYDKINAMDTTISGKQDTISDLNDIRSGASKGETAVQPGDLGTAASKNTGTSAGNVPVLDSNGKLNTTILPAIAITDTFTVSAVSDLTGLTSAEKGDIAIVTGTSETYILTADPYSTAANWKKLATPTDTVTSVNSKTGAVTLDADDISDTNTTNKFVTATDKTNWNAKADTTIVNDTAYGSGWDADTSHAPSKNAVYDKINAMDTTIGGKADDSGVVHKTGNETITGEKTFDNSRLNIHAETHFNYSGDPTDYAYGYGVDLFSKKSMIEELYTKGVFKRAGQGETERTWTLPSDKSGTIALTSDLSGLQTTSNLKTDLTDNSDSYYPSQKAVKTAVDSKQATLVSGTNIKTINNESILGSGNIAISGGTSYESGKNITIEQVGESDMKGPCPSGFHIPTNTEWDAVKTVWTTLGGGGSDGTNFSIALKLPFAGYRYRVNSDVFYQGSDGFYWVSVANPNSISYDLHITSSDIIPNDESNHTYGFSLRGFKNSPVVPDNTWTKLYGTSIEAGGIFWNSDLGLISLSSNGTTWITIADKNLGATTVWNSGDTLSEANCGNYFQRGNNYGFSFTGSVTTSSTQVDASNYGPGNYYESNTFITGAAWDSSDNANLWGGVSQGVDPTNKINADDQVITLTGTDYNNLPSTKNTDGKAYFTYII